MWNHFDFDFDCFPFQPDGIFALVTIIIIVFFLITFFVTSDTHDELMSFLAAQTEHQVFPPPVLFTGTLAEAIRHMHPLMVHPTSTSFEGVFVIDNASFNRGDDHDDGDDDDYNRSDDEGTTNSSTFEGGGEKRAEGAWRVGTGAGGLAPSDPRIEFESVAMPMSHTEVVQPAPERIEGGTAGADEEGWEALTTMSDDLFEGGRGLLVSGAQDPPRPFRPSDGFSFKWKTAAHEEQKGG